METSKNFKFFYVFCFFVIFCSSFSIALAIPADVAEAPTKGCNTLSIIDPDNLAYYDPTYKYWCVDRASRSIEGGKGSCVEQTSTGDIPNAASLEHDNNITNRFAGTDKKLFTPLGNIYDF